MLHTLPLDRGLHFLFRVLLLVLDCGESVVHNTKTRCTEIHGKDVRDLVSNMVMVLPVPVSRHHVLKLQASVRLSRPEHDLDRRGKGALPSCRPLPTFRPARF